MGENTRNHDDNTQAVIAAFDRERDKAHEYQRRLKELLRRSRQYDQPARSDHEIHEQ